MGVIKSSVDKLLLAATGFGALMLGLDYLRNRGAETAMVFNCPYCREPHQMTQSEFAVHVAHARRVGLR